jgi:acyl-CoA synthetase (AMP-forming)/AMP-acid ligase II
MHADADRLAKTLVECRASRVSVVSLRADTLISVLLACERAGCELLLLRDWPGDQSLLWKLWGVDTVLSEAFEVTRLAAPGGTPAGFGVLLSTSGTTGVPKIALHKPDRLMGLVRRLRLVQAAPTWLLTYHPATFAGVQVLLTALAGGGRLVTTSDYSVLPIARAAAAHGVTHVSATPTFWRAFLMALGEEKARLPLQQITLGGEAVDQATLDHLVALYPSTSIIHIYASTEAGALFAVRDRRAGFPSSWLGKTVEGVALRIRNGMLEVLSPRARRLAGILFALLRDGTVYEPRREQLPLCARHVLEGYFSRGGRHAEISSASSPPRSRGHAPTRAPPESDLGDDLESRGRVDAIDPGEIDAGEAMEVLASIEGGGDPSGLTAAGRGGQGLATALVLESSELRLDLVIAGGDLLLVELD